MAVTLSIKSVPDPLAARLRERALRNHRSLQGELMAIIEAAAASQGDEPSVAIPPPARGAIVGFDRRGRPIVRKGTWRIEEIAAELRKRNPGAVRGVPRSVDIVREMRDSR